MTKQSKIQHIEELVTISLDNQLRLIKELGELGARVVALEHTARQQALYTEVLIKHCGFEIVKESMQ